MKTKNGKKILIGLVTTLVLIGCTTGCSKKEKTTTKNKTAEEVTKKDITQTRTDEVKALDLTKGINPKGEITYSNVSDKSDEQLGLSVTANKTKEAELSINWEKFGPHSTASAYANVTETYKITGFTKNVKEGFVGTFGQDSSGAVLLYLMEDGTVEYTKMFVWNDNGDGTKNLSMNYTYDKENDKIVGQHFQTQGVIPNVKDVIKLYNANYSIKNGGGAVTVLGAKKDGSFYDLGSNLNQ